MRNLLEHPITAPEIEACLTQLADQFAVEGRMGDMRPLLLRAAAEMVVKQAPPLKVDLQRAFPGGGLDDSTYDAVETMLDRCDAPCTAPRRGRDPVRWLTLPERVAALSIELGRPPR